MKIIRCWVVQDLMVPCGYCSNPYDGTIRMFATRKDALQWCRPHSADNIPVRAELRIGKDTTS